MTQNPQSAGAATRRITSLLAAFALLSSACATLPRRTPSEPKASVEERPKTENNLRININSASAQELEKLPGIGKTIAERILAHREQYGPFRRPEHLMMVRGISDRKFRVIRALIVVG
ncbi:MAG: helix-hairpin-helix domain-containing protein [Acidobacteriota bacterium]|nr:helix-hairpin-helix domain-containing protein [Acidobacteriota bacterium]